MNTKISEDVEQTTQITIFRGNKIRKILHNNEWWFSIIDVVAVLTDSTDPKQYIKRLRNRDGELNSKWGTICTPLEMTTIDNKTRKVNAANTEGIFRIIQSIPSPKAEPFKRWLAKIGYERIQEIENPELAMKRTRAIYKAKGYPDSWIEKRMRSIAIRDELTDEWKNRGLKQQKEYAILTSEISKATFGMTPNQYKKYKNLKRENLRDHMNDLELIFSMLGEASTAMITRSKDAQGFSQNEEAAKEGGTVAGHARQELEKKSGQKVTSRQNYLKRIKETQES